MNAVRVVAAIAVVLLAASLGLSAYALWYRDKAACESRNTALAVIDDILVFSQGGHPPKKGSAAAMFYADSFTRIHDAQTPC